MPINPAAVAAILPDDTLAAILIIVEPGPDGEPVAVAHRLPVGGEPIATLTGVQILNSIMEPMLEEASDEMAGLQELLAERDAKVNDLQDQAEADAVTNMEAATEYSND